VRITVRVKPAADRTAVSGHHGTALVVAVAARAHDGQATEATLRAVAEQMNVPPTHRPRGAFGGG
jgi:uncharacterized protein YggU (UPF0235/DUF167 family)